MSATNTPRTLAALVLWTSLTAPGWAQDVRLLDCAQVQFFGPACVPVTPLPPPQRHRRHLPHRCSARRRWRPIRPRSCCNSWKHRPSRTPRRFWPGSRRGTPVSARCSSCCGSSPGKGAPHERPAAPAAAPRDRCRASAGRGGKPPSSPSRPSPPTQPPGGIRRSRCRPESAPGVFCRRRSASVPTSGGKTRPGAHPRGHPRSLARLADMDAALRRVSGSRRDWAGGDPTSTPARPPRPAGGPGRRPWLAGCRSPPSSSPASLAAPSLAVALAPPTPWLAPDMQPLALGLSAGWTAWRLLALDRAWRSAGPGSRPPAG